MNTTTNTITIATAADKLGLPEKEFRDLLTGIVKNPATTKKIPVEKFTMIAESLQVRALEQDTQLQTEPDEPVIDQDTQLQIEPDESVIEQEQETSLATTTTEESSELDQERIRIALNINLNLQQQVLDLNRISSALAIIAAEESVKNFEQLYVHTLNDGIDKVLSKVATQTHQTIKGLREVDNSDFLSQHGRSTQVSTSQEIIDQVLQQL